MQRSRALLITLSYDKQNFQEFPRPTYWKESAPFAGNPDARNADRLRAYELLSKHLKLFSDRVEQDTQITITIERVG